MYSLCKYIDVAPAEGYTWSDQEHIAKVRESSDRIDRESQIEEERPAKRYVLTRSISGRYLGERSVSIPWRSITHGSTDRTKSLQTTTLSMARAMRAIFRDAY
jgi:hypothetical protein